jgi:hypothetical protein
MKNIFKITLLASALTFFTGCETVELELLENPNNISTGSADPNFILNDIQLTFARNVWNGFNGTDLPLVRMTNQFGAYNNLVDDLTLVGEWQQAYQMFGNVDLIEAINNGDLDAGGEGIPKILGVAQILEAYAYMVLVDHVNNVPFSEANQPEDFPNPNLDSGAAVYDAQLELLDDAIANLNSSSPVVPASDLFFGSFDADNWIALANTLKIRAFVNLRLTDPGRATAGINQVVNREIIDTEAEDFQFQYQPIQDPVDSRHPLFVNGYSASGAASYMSNYFFDILNAGDAQPPFIENGTPDPRLRYYLYRQTSSAPSGADLPCDGDGRYDYCYVGNLYWGRDHTDDEGIPNDVFKRSTFGLYPAGGAFDKDDFLQARQVVDQTLGGEGILPLFTASHTHFLLAEAALTLGTAGNAANLLRDGIQLSLDKVEDFANVDDGGLGMTQADKDQYIARVIQEFNAAGPQGKLAVISREAFLASWGNAVEIYNTYRRTGFPDLQAPIIPAGPFPRGFRYPNTEVENNPNVQQRDLNTPVFWDNNPGGILD